MLHYRGYRVLITGDLDEEGELAMLAYYQGRNETERLRADVLKVGHHGSKTSSAGSLLDVVNPRIAVIQVGKNNYGHPSPGDIKASCLARNFGVSQRFAWRDRLEVSR